MLPGAEVRLEVGELAAAEVVDNPHLRASLEECVDQMRADERRAARHQDAFCSPIQSKHLPPGAISCADGIRRPGGGRSPKRSVGH